ncbi:MAG TPA: DinB family protein [Planococcus sp. (in: firmicutes)]|nr:DinB family protein [Planococcus sp. (in: firmicutes)]
MTGQDLFSSLKKDLNNYSLEQLKHIQRDGVWSIGQMYDHIILVAHEYLDNMEACAALNEEKPFGKTSFGDQLFKDGGFPPIKIRLPDEMNAAPDNSGSKEKLKGRMEEVIQRLSQWESKVDGVNPNYKVEHGGFGWLNAREWYDLVEMHSRHHLRQKEELESYIL